MVDDSSQTNLSLLGRLRKSPEDRASWAEFVNRYGEMIRRWCFNWGLQESDANDVTQNVLLALAKQMRSFEYRASGRFRSWLKTIAHRAWCDFLTQRGRPGLGTGDDAVFDLLNSIEARNDLLRHLEEECDRNMLEDAMKLVQLRVQDKTWQAFSLTALQGRAGADVARQLNLTIASVYKARSNVQKLIKEEVDRLDAVDRVSVK